MTALEFITRFSRKRQYQKEQNRIMIEKQLIRKSDQVDMGLSSMIGQKQFYLN